MKPKYGIKEYLEEYRQALEQTPQVNQTQKPNVLQLLRGKKETKNEGKWPSV